MLKMFVAIATLKIEHYRRSPLVQGGLEIPCKVSVTIIGIVNNLLVLEKYLQLVEELYIEPKNEEILGSFLHVALEEPAPPPAKKRQRRVESLQLLMIITLNKRITEAFLVIIEEDAQQGISQRKAAQKK